MSETEDFMQEIHRKYVGRHFVDVGCEFHLLGAFLQAYEMFKKSDCSRCWFITRELH